MIDTIDSVCTDGSMAIDRSEKVFFIDCRYHQSQIQKSLTDGLITSMEMRPKISIDSINRYYRYPSIADCAHLCIYVLLFQTENGSPGFFFFSIIIYRLLIVQTEVCHLSLCWQRNKRQNGLAHLRVIAISIINDSFSL